MYILSHRTSDIFQPIPEQYLNNQGGHLLQAERASLIGLRSLLIQAVEALSFILLLIDFRLPDIVATCSPELKQALANLTYKDLLATHQGRDVVRKLVHVIINHRISQGESVRRTRTL
jgi:nuclear pore complex protein Nup155